MDIKWGMIPLEPLDLGAVNQMVAAILSLPADQTREISKLVTKKTGGNPFFVFQFLKTLFEKGILSFDGSWRYNLPAIARADITENLANFMALHLQQQADDVLEIIQTAACIGVQFDPDMIVQITGKSHAVVTEIMARAVHEGLLVSMDDSMKFAHDRVRDAAYGLMD